MKRFTKMALLMVVALVLMGTALMFLWNALMPDLFGLPCVNWLQAVGMFLIGRVFFGGFGAVMMMFGGLMHGIPPRHGGFSHRDWRGMSDEERRRMIDRWHEICNERTSRSGDADGKQ